MMMMMMSKCFCQWMTVTDGLGGGIKDEQTYREDSERRQEEKDVRRVRSRKTGPAMR